MKFRFSTERLSWVSSVAVGLLAACAAGTSQADLLWYDGFSAADYATGAIAGQDGGAGTFFKSNSGTPWEQAGSDAHNVIDTSLTKPGLIHPSAGGSVKDNDCCGRVRQVMTDPWVPGRNSPTGTFYIGFLGNWGGGAPDLLDYRPEYMDPRPIVYDGNGNTVPDVHFRSLEMWNGLVASPTWAGNPDSSVHLQLGFSTFGNFGPSTMLTGVDANADGVEDIVGIQPKLSLKVHDDTGGDMGTGSDITQVLNPNSPLEFRNDGMTHCIVLRFDLSNDPKSDRVRAYLDPMGMSEPAVASADISGIDFTADSMGAISNYVFNTDAVNLPQFDELRVGTTFGDVACMVPEPTTAGMLLVGVLGLLIKRRKVA